MDATFRTGSSCFWHCTWTRVTTPTQMIFFASKNCNKIPAALKHTLHSMIGGSPRPLDDAMDPQLADVDVHFLQRKDS